MARRSHQKISREGRPAILRRELVLRLTAILRRTYFSGGTAEEKKKEPETLVLGNRTVDFGEGSVRDAEHAEIGRLTVISVYAVRYSLNEADGDIDAAKYRTGKYQMMTDALEETANGGYVMGEDGIRILEENGCAFAILLDGGGRTVWEWNKPEEIPAQFSAGEIGAFSKWYLKGYPVFVWRYKEDGLLVAGYPKGSFVRYNQYYERSRLDAILKYIGIFFAVNAILVFALALLFGYRFYRSLKPVGEGIDALAEGKESKLSEKGMTQYLKEKINQASALLGKQRQELERRDTARTEWIAGVSHDIRTPLSLIVGYADEMETDAGLPAVTRQKAGLIRSQSFYIKKLIEDLNLTSKLTYHMQPLRRRMKLQEGKKK